MKHICPVCKEKVEEKKVKKMLKVVSKVDFDKKDWACDNCFSKGLAAFMGKQLVFGKEGKCKQCKTKFKTLAKEHIGYHESEYCSCFDKPYLKTNAIDLCERCRKWNKRCADIAFEIREAKRNPLENKLDQELKLGSLYAQLYKFKKSKEHLEIAKKLAETNSDEKKVKKLDLLIENYKEKERKFLERN